MTKVVMFSGSGVGDACTVRSGGGDVGGVGVTGGDSTDGRTHQHRRSTFLYDYRRGNLTPRLIIAVEVVAIDALDDVC